EIAPKVHPVLDGSIVVGVPREFLRRHDIQRFPLRALLLEPAGDLARDVVLRARSAVPADPFLPHLSRLGPGEHAPLEDHGVELVAHSTGLRLALDLVAVHDASAIGEWTNPIPSRDRPR